MQLSGLAKTSMTYAIQGAVKCSAVLSHVGGSRPTPVDTFYPEHSTNHSPVTKAEPFLHPRWQVAPPQLPSPTTVGTLPLVSSFLGSRARAAASAQEPPAKVAVHVTQEL